MPQAHQNSRTKKESVLVDWDGTIRSGFTIRDWIQYLVDVSLIPRDVLQKIELCFQIYTKGKMSHDELAEKTASVYAESLRGVQVQALLNHAERFVKNVDTTLVPASVHLLELLKQKGLDAIIISGAPIEILRCHAHNLQINHVYGLELAIAGSVYTGRIKTNPGTATSKALVITRLLDAGTKSLVGIGDSDSDMPLFHASRFAVVIDNPTLDTGRKTLYIRGNEKSGIAARRFLEMNVL